MADQHHLLDHPQSLQIQQQNQSPGFPSPEVMLSYVAAMEAALLPCLPARELQAIDRTTHSSHQIDVERHARDFMEAAKKLQLHFISLQYGEQPSEEEMLQKEIEVIEEELKTKSELINRHKMLIEEWEKELNEQLDKHIVQSEKV